MDKLPDIELSEEPHDAPQHTRDDADMARLGKKQVLKVDTENSQWFLWIPLTMGSEILGSCLCWVLVVP